MKSRKAKGRLMDSFGEWLMEQLQIRGWIQADLEQASGLRHGTISNLISGKKGPGTKAALAIAKALKLPPDVVYKEAGLLPATEGEKKEARREAREERLLEIYDQLSDEGKELFINQAESLKRFFGKKNAGSRRRKIEAAT